MILVDMSITWTSLSNFSFTENVTCSDSEWKCASGRQCVPVAWKCDGEVDCQDSSDETACVGTSPKCHAPSISCDNNTRCISPEVFCDGYEHCNDGSDEGGRCGKSSGDVRLVRMNFIIQYSTLYLMLQLFCITNIGLGLII